LMAALMALSTASCAFLAQKPASPKPSPDVYSTEDLSAMETLGGPALRADGEALSGVFRGSSIRMCFDDYVDALRYERDKKNYQALSKAHACFQGCGRLLQGEHAELAQRTRRSCGEMNNKLVDSRSLKDAEDSLNAMESSKTPLNWYESVDPTEKALKEAEGGASSNDASCQKLRQRFEELKKAHAKEIARGRAFGERSDIKILTAEVREKKAEMDLLKKSYERYPTKEKERLWKARQEHVEQLEAKWHAEAEKAGVLKEQ
jgi:hypothetical protein